MYIGVHDSYMIKQNEEELTLHNILFGRWEYTQLHYIIFYLEDIKSDKKTTPKVDMASISQARKAKMQRAERNIIKTLVFVSLVFIFCWTWNEVYI